MESKYSTKILKHLEKKSEVPMEVYRSMSHELHRLQIELLLILILINVSKDSLIIQTYIYENLGQGSPADVREAEPDTVSKQT
ncbi:hypothetical protein MKW94_007929 [Papaver nudicaule]|uniref:Uncharacterized protein n=1 Tax=Papaver nudicaule TaxID=74823 RepID=A0AA41S1P0_PAPNU|nr:hypothetical protein [Papaver nudicaule]